MSCESSGCQLIFFQKFVPLLFFEFLTWSFCGPWVQRTFKSEIWDFNLGNFYSTLKKTERVRIQPSKKTHQDRTQPPEKKNLEGWPVDENQESVDQTSEKNGPRSRYDLNLTYFVFCCLFVRTVHLLYYNEITWSYNNWSYKYYCQNNRKWS